MKFTVSRALLAHGLKIANTVLDKKDKEPGYDQILFAVKNGQLALSGFSRSAGTRYILPVLSHDGEGVFTLPANRIVPLVREFAGGEITFDVVSHAVLLTNGSSSFVSLRLSDKKDFLAFPKIVPLYSFRVPFDILRDTLLRVLPFASTAKGGGPFRNVLFDLEYVDESSVRLDIVATDTVGLARGRVMIDNSFDLLLSEETPSRRILCDRDLILDLLQLLSSDTRHSATLPVTIDVNERYIEISWGEIRFYARVAAATFPDYNAVFTLPRTETSLTFSGSDFAASLRRLAIVSSDETPGESVFSFKVLDKDSGLCLESESTEVGSASEIIPCTHSTVVDLKLNFRYIQLVAELGKNSELTMKTLLCENDPTIWGFSDLPGLSLIVMPVAEELAG